MEPLEIESTERHWYVARTYRREKKIRQRLTEMGIEHFIPFHTVVKEVNGRKKKVEEPVISSLIFVRHDFKGSLSLVNDYRLEMHYVRNRDRTLLRVPDRQMSDFIFLLDHHGDQVEFVSPDLRAGDRVRVIKGDFSGIEGELVRIKGHKRIVVRLDGLLALATVYIPGEYLEKIPSLPAAAYPVISE